MANIIDVNYNTDEYMVERQMQAREQGLEIEYNRANNRVFIRDTLDGEAGIFNMFDFLCADDPLKFFVENF